MGVDFIIGVISFLVACVFIAMLVKGFSDFCNSNRKLDNEARSDQINLKLDFERREYIEQERHRKKLRDANERLRGLCSICQRPETKGQLRFGVCEECSKLDERQQDV